MKQSLNREILNIHGIYCRLQTLLVLRARFGMWMFRMVVCIPNNDDGHVCILLAPLIIELMVRICWRTYGNQDDAFSRAFPLKHFGRLDDTVENVTKCCGATLITAELR